MLPLLFAPRHTWLLGLFAAAQLLTFSLFAAAPENEIPPAAYLLRLTVTDAEAHAVAEAPILLDGALVGSTDGDGVFYLMRRPLADHEHKLTISVPSFLDYSQPVALPTSDDKPGLDLAVKLEPGPPQAPPVVSAPSERGAAEASFIERTIFYATDRLDTQSTVPTERFANSRATAGDLSLGTCKVSLPKDHKPGQLEEASWLRLEFRADPRKHVVLRSIAPLTASGFYQALSKKVEGSVEKEAMVFIHGYNVSFEAAARRTAQLEADLGFDGASIVYSWPSKNKILAYTYDEDSVQWTAIHLREFLRQVAERSGASRIHLIAHSMGNRALSSALQVLAAERRNVKEPLFHQVVLAAPDLGAETFDLLAREIGPLAHRYTVYASANDNALMVSGFLHGGLRAGSTMLKSLILPGIDTVDASFVRTDFLGHSYFGDSHSIVDDIRGLIRDDAAPAARKLNPRVLDLLKYWVIPPPPKSPSNPWNINIQGVDLH